MLLLQGDVEFVGRLQLLDLGSVIQDERFTIDHSKIRWKGADSSNSVVEIARPTTTTY